jgi:hypothetical protein
MKLVQATVTKHPREVTTKYGERTVLDCVTHAGEEVTIWRNGGDTEVLGRCQNEKVTLAVDSKGKYSLISHAGSNFNAITEPEKDNSKAEEIRDYTQRLAKLYSHCFRTVNAEMGESGLPVECLKDIATSLFIQTTRKFEL